MNVTFICGTAFQLLNKDVIIRRKRVQPVVEPEGSGRLPLLCFATKQTYTSTPTAAISFFLSLPLSLSLFISLHMLSTVLTYVLFVVYQVCALAPNIHSRFPLRFHPYGTPTYDCLLPQDSDNQPGALSTDGAKMIDQTATVEGGDAVLGLNDGVPEASEHSSTLAGEAAIEHPSTGQEGEGASTLPTDVNPVAASKVKDEAESVTADATSEYKPPASNEEVQAGEPQASKDPTDSTVSLDVGGDAALGVSDPASAIADEVLEAKGEGQTAAEAEGAAAADDAVEVRNTNIFVKVNQYPC